jgi:hypothetical protein
MVAMRTLLLLPLAGLGAMLAGCTVVQSPPPPVAVSSVAPTGGGNQYCREYTSTATVDGKPQETVGTACQGPDGRWRIMDQGAGQAGDATSAPPQQGYAAPPTVAYPAPYYYPPYPYYYPYPYPAYYGPSIGLGFGFGFGGGGGHRRFR